MSGRDRARLAVLVRASNAAAVARRLGVHVQTCLSLLVGQTANNSTVTFIERQLEELRVACDLGRTNEDEDEDAESKNKDP